MAIGGNEAKLNCVKEHYGAALALFVESCFRDRDSILDSAVDKPAARASFNLLGSDMDLAALRLSKALVALERTRVNSRDSR